MTTPVADQDSSSRLGHLSVDLTLVSDDERVLLKVYRNCSLLIDGLEARLRY
ncbi:hypothetical protein [Streptomyces rubrogriseus]|uniref:hypothetical protein n=1 Tax=Streptomyces rubrogriseus TaxID=194673 RepID=UPI00379F5A4B